MSVHCTLSLWRGTSRVQDRKCKVVWDNYNTLWPSLLELILLTCCGAAYQQRSIGFTPSHLGLFTPVAVYTLCLMTVWLLVPFSPQKLWGGPRGPLNEVVSERCAVLLESDDSTQTLQTASSKPKTKKITPNTLRLVRIWLKVISRLSCLSWEVSLLFTISMSPTLQPLSSPLPSLVTSTCFPFRCRMLQHTTTSPITTFVYRDICSKLYGLVKVFGCQGRWNQNFTREVWL